MKTINKLPTRNYAHPFDRRVRIEGDQETRGVNRSPDAIGGCYGIGWLETFRCHHTGQVYAVHCSDGVNGGKSAHSAHDLEWMEAMRKRIIAHTFTQRSGSVILSSREWAIMLGFTFIGWLDELPSEGEDSPCHTVGDRNRHLDEGQIGTINNLQVVVDPKARDNLPSVGDFGGERPILTRHDIRTPAPRHAQTTRFDGVFAAAFAKARQRAS